MYTRIWACALAFLLFLSPVSSAFAATLGPASSYDALRELLASARNGDTLLVAGDIDADPGRPLTSAVQVHIASDSGASAVIRNLHISDASLSFTKVDLKGELVIDGTSYIQLGRNVHVSGSVGKPALSFSGNGTLIVERGCSVEGGKESPAISIAHSGGDFYGSIEGSVSGGGGNSGGAGLVISPLKDAGAVMISGDITGGDGRDLGGHAVNLYELSGNAYVTVDGVLRGGSGSIGGDGLQLVSASDYVNVGVSGRIKGGAGDSFGGSALLLMNAVDSSSFHLSGAFSGGDAAKQGAQPGTSLQLVGDSTAMRAYVNDCILEDGREYIEETPEEEIAPAITPLPEITSSVDDFEHFETPTPEPTPAPTIAPDAVESPAASPEPESSGEPAPEMTGAPESAEMPEESDAPAADASADTTVDPQMDPPQEPPAPEAGAVLEENAAPESSGSN